MEDDEEGDDYDDGPGGLEVGNDWGWRSEREEQMIGSKMHHPTLDGRSLG